MNIQKIIDVFNYCIKAVQSMRAIYNIIQEAKRDVYLEDRACFYLEKIENEVIKCNLI